ncbi:hypothetical protein N7478_007857 [Penicillium angulare]|uniref:uncharacterized protein n=1 Tax=Penicillium angulare TaxID=116970 RepID=UPI002542095C|nr:uncharacterized protein N7478_007857 [Penicillium angulare]KAJ5272732.1 hypothetical protein N7478_007857 [Penicillium angulare]
MPPIVAGKHRRKVRFPSSTSNTNLNQPPPTQSTLTNQKRPGKSRPRPKLSAATTGKMSSQAATAVPRPGIPDLFTQPSAIRDPLVTETTDLQDATLEKCLPFLKGISSTQQGPFNAYGVPALQRDDHVAFLYDSLEDYPAGFVILDASRPWMAYWGLTGLFLMGEDPTRFRERLIDTLRPAQNSTGGFGGGRGQISHLAGSYAAVLSLAIVGGEDTYALIDRQAMWQWLGRLKQADGGFRVCEGGEEDVRGAYCVMSIISLLDLPSELPPDCEARKSGLTTLTDGLAQYLSRCQTFEGGISGSPGVEAHGAYAYCALACLALLGPPEEIIVRHMNLPLLLSWLSSRQYGPEGGFSGRTNKLVDGCYSHWVGGCWPIIQSALDGKPQGSAPPATTVGSLFSREGLSRYILSCCQSPTGGLRDKPGKLADSYHTCYVLAGLSAMQHYHYRTDSATGSNKSWASAFTWRSTPIREDNVYEKSDRLAPLHPLYGIPFPSVDEMRLWCEAHPITP